MRKLLLALFMTGSAALSAAGINNLVNVSWGDAIVVAKGINRLDSPESIKTALKYWQDKHDIQTVLWRIGTDYIMRYYEMRAPSPFYAKWNELCRNLYSKFYAPAVVRQFTRENGQKLMLYATFNDHGAPTSVKFGGYVDFPWQDKLTIAHPEYQERDLAGNYHYGVLDLSNPAVRKIMVDRLAGFVKEFDADGLYLCSRTHSKPADHADQFGFGPEVVKEYQKRYGIDITKDKRFDYRAPEYAPKSPEVENWRKLRGEYLVQFTKELKEAMPGRLLYIALPRGGYYEAPYGNMVLDYNSMITNKYIDGLVLNVISGRYLYGYDKVKHADRGYLCSTDDNYNMPGAMESIRALSPLCKKNGVALFFSGISDARFRKETSLRRVLDGVSISMPTVLANVRIKDSAEMRSGALSVDGWFNIPKDQGQARAPRLISKYAHAESSERGWELYIEKDKLIFRTYVKWGDKKEKDYYVVSNEPIKFDQWIHCAGVYDPAKAVISVYVNGKLAGSKKLPAGTRLNSNPSINACIGSYPGYVSQELTAHVDNVRITKRAINFAAGIPEGKDADTLVLLTFDGKDYFAPGQGVIDMNKAKTVDGKFGKALSVGW